MSKFDHVLELADSLDGTEREQLISILQARLRDERRAVLAAEIQEANSEFDSGSSRPASVNEIVEALKH